MQFAHNVSYTLRGQLCYILLLKSFHIFRPMVLLFMLLQKHCPEPFFTVLPGWSQMLMPVTRKTSMLDIWKPIMHQNGKYGCCQNS